LFDKKAFLKMEGFFIKIKLICLLAPADPAVAGEDWLVPANPESVKEIWGPIFSLFFSLERKEPKVQDCK
jgi:hypothetical protein